MKYRVKITSGHVILNDAAVYSMETQFHTFSCVVKTSEWNSNRLHDSIQFKSVICYPNILLSISVSYPSVVVIYDYEIGQLY